LVRPTALSIAAAALFDSLIPAFAPPTLPVPAFVSVALPVAAFVLAALPIAAFVLAALTIATLERLSHKATRA